jgi:hypothetical protein
MNPVHSLPSYLFKIHFIIIVPSILEQGVHYHVSIPGLFPVLLKPQVRFSQQNHRQGVNHVRVLTCHKYKKVN